MLSFAMELNIRAFTQTDMYLYKHYGFFWKDDFYCMRTKKSTKKIQTNAKYNIHNYIQNTKM